jgi:hypothetical protein
MVNEQEQDSGREPAYQGVCDVVSEPNKINASTPYDFSGKSLADCCRRSPCWRISDSSPWWNRP